MHRFFYNVRQYIKYGLPSDVKHFITKSIPWLITETIPHYIKRVAPKFYFHFVWHLAEIFNGVLYILDGILKIISLGFIKFSFTVKWTKFTFSFLSRLRRRLSD